MEDSVSSEPIRKFGTIEDASVNRNSRGSTSKTTAYGQALVSWSRDISRCAGLLPREWVPARPFPSRNLPARPLSSDCSLGSETAARRDRKEFARRDRNRADRSGNRAWHLLPRYQGLPPAICKREFLPPDQCRVLPVACKQARRRLLRRFVARPHVIDSRNRIGASRTRRR